VTKNTKKRQDIQFLSIDMNLGHTE